jgi:nitrogenase-associated protein
MTTIVFYEKPGCGNNTRQKNLLLEAGHELIVFDLLSTPWTADQLRPFFQARPVAEWFNRAAPRVKSGEVVPELLDETAAMALLLADHLLIRRPLLQIGERKDVGFDPERIAAWIGSLDAESVSGDLENCNRSHNCAPTNGLS